MEFIYEKLYGLLRKKERKRQKECTHAKKWLVITLKSFKEWGDIKNEDECWFNFMLSSFHNLRGCKVKRDWPYITLFVFSGLNFSAVLYVVTRYKNAPPLQYSALIQGIQLLELELYKKKYETFSKVVLSPKWL